MAFMYPVSQQLRHRYKYSTSLQWRHNVRDCVWITYVSIVCSTACSGADLRNYQSSASLAFAMGIHRWPVDSLHKGPVTPKCSHMMTSSCFMVKQYDPLSISQIQYKIITPQLYDRYLYVTLSENMIRVVYASNSKYTCKGLLTSYSLKSNIGIIV